MKELTEYRQKLLEKLLSAVHAFREACLRVKDPYAPLDENGWTVHQVAVHTRDVDKLVYGLRARRTFTEENPEFQNFDGEAYIAEHYDAGEPLKGILDGLVDNVQSLVEILRGLRVEAWSRESRHATLGSGFTLQTWVEKDLAHIEEHLETMKKAG